MEQADIERSQQEFMDSCDEDDIDRGMEMLGGVIMTLILTGILGILFAVAGWLR